jgi:hypothetical protein
LKTAKTDGKLANLPLVSLVVILILGPAILAASLAGETDNTTASAEHRQIHRHLKEKTALTVR